MTDTCLVALVVTFDSEASIDSCLDALIPMPVIVVDNNSTDMTRMRALNYPNVEYVQNSRNVGLARAVNQGLQVAGDADVFLVNPDVVAPAEDVYRLHSRLQDLPTVGVIAPRLIGSDGSIQPSARTFQTPATVWARRTNGEYRAARRACVLQEHLAPTFIDRCSTVPWVLGAAILVRRSAIHTVGGMDDRFFLYHEDQDWCIRMWRAGWEVCLEPGICLSHSYRRASRSTFTRASWHHAQSSIHFYRKYPSLLCGISPVAVSRGAVPNATLGLSCDSRRV